VRFPFERPLPSILVRVERPSGEFVLRRRAGEAGTAVYELILDGKLLMDTAEHASEEALAEIALRECDDGDGLHVMLGGLGFGFTLGAALRDRRVARVDVIELEPMLVSFLARPEVRDGIGGPDLSDPRVAVEVRDVRERIALARGDYDLLLLDVDNGPERLSADGNGELYTPAGLAACRSALRPGGALAIWSSEPAPACLRNLQDVFGNARESVVPVERAGRTIPYRILTSRRVEAAGPRAPRRP
jgi:spermidine synthase